MNFIYPKQKVVQTSSKPTITSSPNLKPYSNLRTTTSTVPILQKSPLLVKTSSDSRTMINIKLKTTTPSSGITNSSQQTTLMPNLKRYTNTRTTTTTTLSPVVSSMSTKFPSGFSPTTPHPNTLSPTSSRPRPIPMSNPSTPSLVTPSPSPMPNPSTPNPGIPSLMPDPSTTNPSIPSPLPDPSTPSARELRVKTSRVSASLNTSQVPGGGQQDRGTRQGPEEQTHSPAQAAPPVAIAPRDCSDHMISGEQKNGVYQVTPDPRNRTFSVVCDMTSHGGGWTLLQHRHDGSMSFNRTWQEYRAGFGDLEGGEFWLGNDHIHLLTQSRAMVLRVDLEDFQGTRGYAEYSLFRVASERTRYRLSVGGYSGTAGDALHFSKKYDHNNRAFTTSDRDNDRYPSGNCGVYYGSGWWFDACMAANLNGRYYVGRYKGVRNGIYWGTWHNISAEYYPTNYRHTFKTVSMMIRPRGFTS